VHHSLKLYSRYREAFLRYYIFQAKWTKLPFIGGLVRWVANLYGQRVSQACLLTPDEANEIIDSSASLALGPCSCRQVFHNCTNPIDSEIMIGLSGNAFVEERPHECKEITKEKAKDVLRECHQRGLIHTIVKCRGDFYAICNCCSCCCVPLRLNKLYGIGNAVSRSKDIVNQFKESAAAEKTA